MITLVHHIYENLATFPSQLLREILHNHIGSSLRIIGEIHLVSCSFLNPTMIWEYVRTPTPIKCEVKTVLGLRISLEVLLHPFSNSHFRKQLTVSRISAVTKSPEKLSFTTHVDRSQWARRALCSHCQAQGCNLTVWGLPTYEGYGEPFTTWCYHCFLCFVRDKRKAVSHVKI